MGCFHSRPYYDPYHLSYNKPGFGYSNGFYYNPFVHFGGHHHHHGHGFFGHHHGFGHHSFGGHHHGHW